MADKQQPGTSELRSVLRKLLEPAADGRLLAEEMLLRSRVYRLKFDIDGAMRSFVVKRHSPSQAQLERLLVEKWLPEAGLERHAPPLIAAAAEISGKCIWHIYRDVGDSTMSEFLDDADIVREAVALFGKVHAFFTGHILLGECAMHGGDYGSGFYSTSVIKAMSCLRHLKNPNGRMRHDHADTVDGLLELLAGLHERRASHEEIMREYGGPDTLLHGDLWPKNCLVEPNDSECRILIIDWDHAGVGPVSYDLSTFLMKLPEEERIRTLNLYIEIRDDNRYGWPSYQEWNMLFETNELARLSNCIIWPCIAARHDMSDWAFEDLARIRDWFNGLKPVLPIKHRAYQYE